MQCRYCRASIAAGAPYCGNCGRPAIDASGGSPVSGESTLALINRARIADGYPPYRSLAEIPRAFRPKLVPPAEVGGRARTTITPPGAPRRRRNPVSNPTLSDDRLLLRYRTRDAGVPRDPVAEFDKLLKDTCHAYGGAFINVVEKYPRGERDLHRDLEFRFPDPDARDRAVDDLLKYDRDGIVEIYADTYEIKRRPEPEPPWAERERRPRRNPDVMGYDVPAKALAMYQDFWQLDPDKVGEFPRSFRIPEQANLVGEAKHVMYRSQKTDPSTGKVPRNPIDYIHEHEDGVRVYRCDTSAGTPTKVRGDILSINDGASAHKNTGLVLLGGCLGYAYDDGTGIREVGAKGELYTIPSGKALLVIVGKSRVVAMIWGGSLGVEPRGIVY